ncbi:MAG TPA: helix-turn-helix domain-containing protein [Acidimicrobiales bacterium]
MAVRQAPTPRPALGPPPNHEPPSPPTDRVVRVLNLLVGLDQGATVTEIAQQLGLNRSTCSAILATLEQRGWVTRHHARTYSLGDGLLSLAEAARSRLPILQPAASILERLTERTGYRATLSRADGEHLTIIAASGPSPAGGPSRGLGNRVPMHPPFGTAIAAWLPDADRARWMDRSDLTAQDRAELDRYLDAIRRNSFSARPFDPANQPALALIQDLVSTLGSVGDQSELREDLVRILHSHGGTGLTPEQLDAPGPLGISYLVAPVFEDGQPRYQLELHVLRGDVDRSERRRCIEQLLAAARELSERASASSA